MKVTKKLGVLSTLLLATLFQFSCSESSTPLVELETTQESELTQQSETLTEAEVLDFIGFDRAENGNLLVKNFSVFKFTDKNRNPLTLQLDFGFDSKCPECVYELAAEDDGPEPTFCMLEVCVTIFGGDYLVELPNGDFVSISGGVANWITSDGDLIANLGSVGDDGTICIDVPVPLTQSVVATFEYDGPGAVTVNVTYPDGTTCKAYDVNPGDQGEPQSVGFSCIPPC